MELGKKLRSRLSGRERKIAAEEAAQEAADLAEWWAPLLDGLHLVAGERTPLPVTGEPPDWTTGSPADAVRTAGRSYLDRARAQLAGGSDTSSSDTSGSDTSGNDMADGCPPGGVVEGVSGGSVGPAGGAW